MFKVQCDWEEKSQHWQNVMFRGPLPGSRLVIKISAPANLVWHARSIYQKVFRNRRKFSFSLKNGKSHTELGNSCYWILNESQSKFLYHLCNQTLEIFCVLFSSLQIFFANIWRQEVLVALSFSFSVPNSNSEKSVFWHFLSAFETLCGETNNTSDTFPPTWCSAEYFI